MSDGLDTRVAESFARQPLMATFGATLVRAKEGVVVIAMEPGAGLLQQHGFIHGGVIMALADTAAGYASMSVVEAGTEVLTIEMKTNFLRPAKGRITAEGRVVRAGRSVIVAGAEVYAEDGTRRLHVATALGTMAAVTHLG